MWLFDSINRRLDRIEAILAALKTQGAKMALTEQEILDELNAIGVDVQTATDAINALVAEVQAAGPVTPAVQEKIDAVKQVADALAALAAQANPPTPTP